MRWREDLEADSLAVVEIVLLLTMRFPSRFPTSSQNSCKPSVRPMRSFASSRALPSEPASRPCGAAMPPPSTGDVVKGAKRTDEESDGKVGGNEMAIAAQTVMSAMATGRSRR